MLHSLIWWVAFSFGENDPGDHSGNAQTKTGHRRNSSMKPMVFLIDTGIPTGWVVCDTNPPSKLFMICNIILFRGFPVQFFNFNRTV
jgi:hypothetical protein